MVQRPPVGRIRILEPPYQALTLSPVEPVPLGSALVLDLGEGEPALEDAVVWQGRAAWCPLALIVRTVPPTAGSIVLLTQLHGPLAFVEQAVARTDPTMNEIVSAVRRRPGPTAEAMFTYVADRLQLVWLRGLFEEAEAFATPHLDGHHPVSRQVGRRLRALGPLGVPDWRWLFRLARLSGAGQVPVEELARRHGVGARSFRAQVHRYTGVPVRTFREWIGWEWVIEAALRRCGYLDRDVIGRAAREA